MATRLGASGDDTLDGTSARDRIYGAGGDDTIRGFAGRDVLVGESGKDRIIGGEGDDVLTGDGTSESHFSDTFVFGKDSGKDVITDFDIDKDMLEIARGLNGIKKAADVLDHAKQKKGDVVIDLGDGNKIILKNVKLADLEKNPKDHFDIV